MAISGEQHNSEALLIGEVHQKFHLFNRVYDCFNDKQQFAYVDEKPFAWTFSLRDADGTVLATVTKEFTSIAREILTDYNLYTITLNPQIEQKEEIWKQSYSSDSNDKIEIASDAAEQQSKEAAAEQSSQPKDALPQRRQLTDREKLLIIASSISIDFDYFSNNSLRGGKYARGVFAATKFLMSSRYFMLSRKAFVGKLYGAWLAFYGFVLSLLGLKEKRSINDQQRKTGVSSFMAADEAGAKAAQ